METNLKQLSASSSWIVGSVLLLLIAAALWQTIADHRREEAAALQKQQATEQAEAKMQATQLKLDNDAKEFERTCGDNGGDTCVQPLAEAGNAAAQYLLGYHLEAEHNYKSAISWYEKSANQGNTEAMKQLGGTYYLGDWTKNHGDYLSDSLVDGRKAIYWYRMAADLGDKDAMRTLGEIYRAGEITPQDYGQARQWFEKGAKAGDRASLMALGFMADRGEGASPDLIDAYRWFSIGCAAYSGTMGCSERDEVATHLSPPDILKAQALASDWEQQFRK